jgi:hypothetical protein
MVIFEAARAICGLRDVTARELSPAITVLQLFLSSSKPVLRFAAGACACACARVATGVRVRCWLRALLVPRRCCTRVAMHTHLARMHPRAPHARHPLPPHTRTHTHAQCARSTAWP